MRLRTLALPAVVLTLGAYAAHAQDAATPPAADGPKVQLVVKLEKGQTVWFRQTMKSDSDVDIGGMQMAQGMEMNQTWSQTCDAVADGGTMDIRMKFLRLWGGMTNPMLGEIKFDSDNPSADSENPMAAMMTEAMTALAGKEITTKMKPSGAISDATLPDDLGGNPAVGESMKQMMNGLQGVSGLPEKPVGVGDSWDTNTTMSMQGLKITVSIKSTVTKVEDESVSVAQTGTMTMGADTEATADGGENPMAEMMKKLKLKDSSMKGTSRISRKDGLVLESDVDQTLSMEMELPPEAAEQGMAGGLSITAKTKTRIERTAKPAEKAAEAPKDGAPATPAGPDSGK